jgi:hypothetical protein
MQRNIIFDVDKKKDIFVNKYEEEEAKKWL